MVEFRGIVDGAVLSIRRDGGRIGRTLAVVGAGGLRWRGVVEHGGGHATRWAWECLSAPGASAVLVGPVAERDRPGVVEVAFVGRAGQVREHAGRSADQLVTVGCCESLAI
ncbi:MAG: hypothetical protein ACRDT8_15295 [Micromonosporaceae bacterium]